MVNQIEKIKMIDLDQHNDNRGKMVVVEGLKNIPFDIKRIFYIYETDPDIVRGCHANKRSEFVMINISGSSIVRVRAKNFEKNFVLDKPYKGLYLPKMTWKEMHSFSPDSILLVLSSELYDENEYIRNYEEFLKEGALI